MKAQLVRVLRWVLAIALAARWLYIWGVASLVVAGYGSTFLMLLADVSLPEWWPWKVDGVVKLPESARGNALVAAVSWFGGVIGLYTFFLNRHQKQEHLDSQLAKDREVAELQRLEAMFGQLAEDFSSTVTLNRISAAIGLAELARKPDPRRAVSGRVPREWRPASTKNETNYPYFMRAANRLAAAIHQWTEQPARDEARKALRQMAEFAKDEGTDEPLLHALCNSLADSNRTALSLFVDTLAKCLATTKEAMLPTLANFCSFQQDRAEDDAEVLRFIAETSEAVQAINRHRARSLTQATGCTAVSWKEHLEDLCWSARALADARDALAEALCELSTPVGMPRFWRRRGNKLFEMMFMDIWFSIGILDVWQFRRHRGLQLYECFLQGTSLSYAQLQGARLWGAQLQGTSLRRANLQGAHIHAAYLQGARLGSAQMQRADLDEAQLQGANLAHAQLQMALLREAKLQGADLEFAQLLGADLRDANLESTRMNSAACGQNGAEAAKFSLGGWIQGDFRVYSDDGLPTEEEDTVLKAWLEEKYPARPDADPELVVPPSPE